MEQLTTPQLFAIWILPLLFAITVHEAAHGWVAHKLGDNTAHALGRVTLNPLKHIDWLGTVFVPLMLLTLTGFVFGWAKPVPISWQNLHHPRRDMVLVALAGPFANLLMIFLWAGLAKIGLLLFSHHIEWARAINYMGLAGININLLLMLLNLIPIPPLDGSRVIYSLLPTHLTARLGHFEFAGLIILLLLLLSGLLNPIIITPFMWLRKLLVTLFSLN